MRQWKTALLAALCVAVAAWAVSAYWGRSEEPSYQGKALSAWIRLYYNKTQPPTDWAPQSQQNLATDAVRHMSSNALPLLVEWAAYDGFSERNKFMAKLWPLNKIEVLGQIYSRRNEFRAEAAGKALISLGPDATSALPEVARTFYDPTSRDGPARSLWILRESGQPGLLVLKRAAEDTQNPMRTTVIHNLAFLRTNALLAVPTLTKLLQDPDPAVRYASKQALNRILGVTIFQPQ
jgi:hypothetical protein